MTLPAATLTRLEKVAVDNGFDLTVATEDDWLGFASTQAPLRLWLSFFGDAVYIAAFSQLHVARALSDYGTAMAAPLPAGAVAGRTANDVASLHRLVRRAFQLSRTLPNELLHTFEKKTASLPRATEVERLVVQRIGQDVFRAGLIDYWEGRCAITGLSVVELLRASHIKPWAACETDAVRLDIFNGLLLAPHLDAAFDRGLIAVADDGRVLVSPRIGGQDRARLGLQETLKITALTAPHRGYLEWHRTNLFQEQD